MNPHAPTTWHRRDAGSPGTISHPAVRGRLAVAVLAGTVLLTPLAACAGQGPAASETTPAARRITEEEAQRLGVLRFRNYDAGVRAVDVRLPATPDNEELSLVGWVDFVEHRGYVTVTEGSSGLEAVTGELVWDGANLAIAPPPDGAEPHTAPPLPPTPDGWSAGPLDPTTSQMTTIMVLLLSLGSDRPENSSLLLQSDAAWLGTSTLAGTPVDVFAGPSEATSGIPAPTSTAAPDFTTHVQYWLDKTGTAHRVVVPLGTDALATIDLGPVDDSTGVDLSAVGDVLTAPR